MIRHLITQYLFFVILGIDFISHHNISAATLHVGIGQTYLTLPQAASVAMPGDTILIHEGIHQGGIYINELQGTPDAWIYIHSVPGELVVFEGGTNAWQFTDGAYLHIRGFTFQHQTGNGLNFDDGGTYDSPAHHIIFEDCTFRDMNAGGNNDLLKLSGLDHFEIRNCVFMNGSAVGSGIDMVGCHEGLITLCHFENMGSNAIQAKGGTSHVRIEANFFKNAGNRSINLGGSTGLAFFRPIDAPYEASDLKVYSNIFIGSEAPIAFVGCIHTEVINNTIYLPGKWVLRILQETVDPDRFPPCGQNTFRNNIVYINNNVSVECNIGPNTAPETFTFSNNLWFHAQNAGWAGPNLPVEDVDNLINENPLFEDVVDENFDIQIGSPAIGNGYDVEAPTLDFGGEMFLLPRSIGAFEGGEFTSISGPSVIPSRTFTVWPNPGTHDLYIEFSSPPEKSMDVQIFLSTGTLMHRDLIYAGKRIQYIAVQNVPPGTYVVSLSDGRSCVWIKSE